MPVFYIYARQSTSDQTSLEAQLEAGHRTSKQYPGYEVRPVKEEGSGRNLEGRPEFLKILDGLKEGDVVSVWDSSRLGRNAESMQVVRRTVRLRKATIIEGGKIYEDTAHDKLVSGVLDNVSEFVRELQLEKSLSGIETRRNAGNWRFGDLFGYDHDAKQKTVLINEEQARIVRWIFSENEAGRSLNKICQKLNEDRIFTIRKGRWTPTTVRRILLRPLYAGYYASVGPGAKKGTYTLAKDYSRDGLIKSKFYAPIIDLDTYERSLRILMTEERPHQKRSDKRGSRYLFTGFIYCGVCMDQGRKRAETCYVHQTQKVRRASTENEIWKLSSFHDRSWHPGISPIWNIRHKTLHQLLIHALYDLLRERGDEVDYFLLNEKLSLEERLLERSEIGARIESELDVISRAIGRILTEQEATDDLDLSLHYRNRLKELSEERARRRNDLLELKNELRLQGQNRSMLENLKSSVESAFFPRRLETVDDTNWVFENELVSTTRERAVLKEYLKAVTVHPDYYCFHFVGDFKYKFGLTRRFGTGHQAKFPAHFWSPQSDEWRSLGVYQID